MHIHRYYNSIPDSMHIQCCCMGMAERSVTCGKCSCIQKLFI